MLPWGPNSIRNIEVRRRLAIYYKNVEVAERLMEGIPPYRENLRQHMPYTVQALAISERCENKRVVDARGNVRGRCRRFVILACRLKQLPQAFPRSGHRSSKPKLVHRISDLDYKLSLSQRLIERGQALDQFLCGSGDLNTSRCRLSVGRDCTCLGC